MYICFARHSDSGCGLVRYLILFLHPFVVVRVATRVLNSVVPLTADRKDVEQNVVSFDDERLLGAWDLRYLAKGQSVKRL